LFTDLALTKQMNDEDTLASHRILPEQLLFATIDATGGENRGREFMQGNFVQFFLFAI
jgi:hypothetical protein